MKQHPIEVATQQLSVAIGGIQEALQSNGFKENDIPALTVCAKTLRLATPQMEGQAMTCDGLTRMIRQRIALGGKE